MPYNLLLKVFTQRNLTADFLQEKSIVDVKTVNFRYEPLWDGTGNVRCSS